MSAEVQNKNKTETKTTPNHRCSTKTTDTQLNLLPNYLLSNVSQTLHSILAHVSSICRSFINNTTYARVLFSTLFELQTSLLTMVIYVLVSFNLMHFCLAF